MKIETIRFGAIDIEEGDLIQMTGPILGFERLTRFVLLIHDEHTPLWWLQSAEDPGVAFVVADPRALDASYAPSISTAERELLGIRRDEEMVLLSIVTVRVNPFRVTANLRAPILVHTAHRTARQVVLEDPTYPIQYDVFDHRDRFLLSADAERASYGGAGALGKCVAAL